MLDFGTSVYSLKSRYELPESFLLSVWCEKVEMGSLFTVLWAVVNCRRELTLVKYVLVPV